MIWGAVRKNIISDRFSTKTAISPRNLHQGVFTPSSSLAFARIADREKQIFLQTGHIALPFNLI